MFGQVKTNWQKGEFQDIEMTPPHDRGVSKIQKNLKFFLGLLRRHMGRPSRNRVSRPRPPSLQPKQRSIQKRTFYKEMRPQRMGNNMRIPPRRKSFIRRHGFPTLPMEKK